MNIEHISMLSIHVHIIIISLHYKADDHTSVLSSSNALSSWNWCFACAKATVTYIISEQIVLNLLQHAQLVWESENMIHLRYQWKPIFQKWNIGIWSSSMFSIQWMYIKYCDLSILTNFSVFSFIKKPVRHVTLWQITVPKKWLWCIFLPGTKRKCFCFQRLSISFIPRHYVLLIENSGHS